MSAEEDNGAEEAEEVTRCVCGNVDLKVEDDDEDTGLFVQCDKCLVWQHGYCVGLLDDSQVPETYFCELCRPDLHRLVSRPRKLPRSKFLGIENAASPPAAGAQLEEINSILEESENTSSRKRRSTMNSRDAAYDRQLEAALLLSAQQNGGAVEMPAPSLSGRSGRNARRSSPSFAKRGRTPSPSPTREDTKQKRRRKGASNLPAKKDELIQDEDQASVSSTRRRGGKKKSTSSRNAATADQEEQAATENGIPSSSSSSRPRSATTDRVPAASVNNDSRPTSRVASRESTPVPIPAANSRKRGNGRSSKKSGPPAVSRGNTNVSVAVPSTPSSGRLTAMSEMRKRVSAILEYVGRMQEDMATEVTEWSQFVPEDDLAASDGKQRREDSVWSYGYEEGGSIMLMEDLTGNLLRWESLYG